MFKNSRARSKTRGRIMTGLMVFAILLTGLMAISVGSATPARADAAHQVEIGMPFAGQWAWNVKVDPPYTDANSSHPSVHHTPGGGDWATDVYATEGTAVKLEVGNATGAVTYSWGSSSTSCGQSTLVNVFVDKVNVGWLYFAHLNNAVTSGAITNGMTLGTVHDWGGCNPGVHVHIEFKNVSNYACYVDNGHPGVTLSQGTGLGVLGSTNTGAQQACSSVPGSSPSSPPHLTTHVTPDNIQHVYSGTATGSLYETWWGPSAPSPTTWQITNVGGAITGISAQVTPDGNEHVYYGTVGGTVGEIWWGPNSGGVHNGQSYNIGAAVTALSSQVTPDGVQHIYSADAAGSLYETWWGSNPEITSQIYNTGVDIVSISSQVTADGTEHIFFGATNGEVGEVWWNATSGGGHLGSTANVGTNVIAVSSQITADGVRHIYSANSVGGLDETWWGPNSSGPTTWQVANVGHHPTAISSQVTSDGIEHIYYGTSFGQFGEVWWNANGVHLGQGYSDPAGVADSAISSQLTASGTQQNIYAVNTAGTLFALWWSSGAATTSAVGRVS